MVENIPKEVINIIETLADAGFEAYIVGGCVRDLIMDRKPTDWDVTTNAKPEEVQKLFADSFYENTFGTVGVKTRTTRGLDADSKTQTDSEADHSLDIVEVTTYRTESKYTDKRHPDEIKFAKTLEEDLQRRDFAMNAMAARNKKYERRSKKQEERSKDENDDSDLEIIDPFDGQKDIENKIIRAVGNAEERFGEDALRMLRAVRFAATLGFAIEKKTLEAITKLADNLKLISTERVRDELCKLVMGERAQEAIELLRHSGLLKYIIPELLEGVDVGQNLHHIYTVWEHNLRALGYACQKKYSLEIRLASLLHDVGKPRSKRGDGYHSTFYGHEVIGARMGEKILYRLKFPKEQAEKIIKLIRFHLFYYNPGEVTETSVRRLVANIGKENVEDLLKVREADRIGSGTPKAVPYKLRHLKFMIDKVARDPISPKMLKINGNDIMELLTILPGPKVGMIMNALMEEVLEDPSKNTREYLESRSLKLMALSEEELSQLAKQGKLKTMESEEEEVGKIKAKHYI